MALAFAVVLPSCNEPETKDDVLAVSILSPEYSAAGGSQFVTVNAPGEWTLSIETADAAEGVAWAWFTEWGSDEEVVTLKGSGDAVGIQFYWARNNATEPRTCTIRLTSGSRSASCSFSQAKSDKQPVTPVEVVSDPVPSGWMELPALADGLYFFTHSMTIGVKSCRNYSFSWDIDNLVAPWVAYPLNTWSISSGGRTNAWGLDPKLPQSAQPVLYSGFKGGYQRGHQCPSADRLSPAANEATFYGTNMTPQRGELNEQIWATLEGAVRSWAYSFDTLYVVTGCDVRGATDVAYDNVGKAVTVPVGYYKALLGYKKDGSIANTGRTGGYSGCAFYLEHRGYTNSRAYLLDANNHLQMSISDLEKKMGIDFFVNLPSAIGGDLARTVESTVDSYWKK